MSQGFERIERGFDEIIASGSSLRRIADGFEFTEGPAWFDGGLIFSDIPANTIYAWREGDSHRVWRTPSQHANGNTVDREGRLITCEHRSRRVTRTESDGRVTVLADRYRGNKLNSPNDAVVKSDGSVWFTDPHYGIKPEEREQPANFLFRLRGEGEEPAALVDDFSMPNGLCFSPDEALLYIADSDHEIHHVRRFRVRADGGLEGGEVFVTIEPGVPDGMRTDSEGRLYVSAGDGVQVFDTSGMLLGKIRTPQTTANCTFGGPERRTLFLTAVSTVWAVELAVGGR